jgi:hypothetical protein
LALTAVLWNDPNLSRGTDGLQTRRWRNGIRTIGTAEGARRRRGSLARASSVIRWQTAARAESKTMVQVRLGTRVSSRLRAIGTLFGRLLRPTDLASWGAGSVARAITRNLAVTVSAAPRILLCSSLPAGGSARHWHKWEESHELVTS